MGRFELVLMLALAVTAVLLAALTGSSEATSHHKLPSSFKRCALDDPQLGECLEEALMTALQVLKNGVPSLGVMPLDPLRVDQLNIEGGGTGSVKFDMYYKNITFSGLSAAKVIKHSARLVGNTMEFQLLIPELRNDFKHEINGKILVFPIRGKGPGSAVLSEFLTNHTIKFTPMQKKDGRTYWNVDEFIFKIFRPKGMSVQFLGLFPENKKLGQEMTKFMNQNSFLLFEELVKYFEEAMEAIYKEMAVQVFSKVPADEIFLMPEKKEAPKTAT